MKTMSGHGSNFISIASGITVSTISYLQTAASSSSQLHSLEFFKVFLMGFTGGVAGYIGKAVVHKLILVYKRRNDK